MPLYPIACHCGFHGEVLARAADVADDGTLKCPVCAANASQDYAAKSLCQINRAGKPQASREFKNKSIVHQFHPEDAGGIAELMGPEGKYIQRDGTVEFKNKGESRAFNQKWAALLERAKQKEEAKKAKEPPQDQSENVPKKRTKSARKGLVVSKE